MGCWWENSTPTLSVASPCGLGFERHRSRGLLDTPPGCRTARPCSHAHQAASQVFWLAASRESCRSLQQQGMGKGLAGAHQGAGCRGWQGAPPSQEGSEGGTPPRPGTGQLSQPPGATPCRQLLGVLLLPQRATAPGERWVRAKHQQVSIQLLLQKQESSTEGSSRREQAPRLKCPVAQHPRPCTEGREDSACLLLSPLPEGQQQLAVAPSFR